MSLCIREEISYNTNKTSHFSIATLLTLARERWVPVNVLQEFFYPIGTRFIACKAIYRTTTQ
ncbi:hypothetical protein KSC_013880 [Ktedonobacter sp. SOSP1-52]|nr:hypothetical protein KSC_013880 [Ktedonobacter sp. SOSP1-52]